MSTANNFDARFREPPVANFACIHELSHCACDFFDRHGWVNTVLVKQINSVRPQPAKRRVCHLLDMLRPTVKWRVLLLAFSVDVPAKFRRDHDLVAEWLNSLADDLFIHPRSVNLRCVEERNSPLVRRTDQLDTVFLVETGPEPKADTHAPQSER